jgi:hypothetical protein
VTGPPVVMLSLPELAAWLDPPLPARRLALLFRALGIEPDGQRAGKVGRPVNLYDAGKVMRLHAAVVPFLGAPAPEAEAGGGSVRPATASGRTGAPAPPGGPAGSPISGPPPAPGP